jgi:hypothetical protein
MSTMYHGQFQTIAGNRHQQAQALPPKELAATMAHYLPYTNSASFRGCETLLTGRAPPSKLELAITVHEMRAPKSKKKTASSCDLLTARNTFISILRAVLLQPHGSESGTWHNRNLIRRHACADESPCTPRWLYFKIQRKTAVRI